jgi:hypothetical protein
VSELEPRDRELERRLDAAFAGTGPRRGFEDEVWARIGPRARRPRDLAGLFPGVGRGALAAAGAAALIGLLVFGVTHAGHGPSGSSSASTASQPASNGSGSGFTAPGASGASRAQPALEQGPPAFGRLPTPILTGIGGAAGAPSSGPIAYLGPAHLTVTARLPAIPASLPVYRFAIPAEQAGAAAQAYRQADQFGNPVPAAVTVGASGQVIQAWIQLPGSLTSSAYQTRDGAAAARDALNVPPATSRGLSPTPRIQLTQAAVVYIAVLSNGAGYFEPAYLFSGRFSAGGSLYEKRVLVPALQSSQLQ